MTYNLLYLLLSSWWPVYCSHFTHSWKMNKSFSSLLLPKVEKWRTEPRTKPITRHITYTPSFSDANHFIRMLSCAFDTLWHYKSSRLSIFSRKMNPNGLQRFGSPSNALKLTTGSKPQTVLQHALKIHPSSHWVTSGSLDFIWPPRRVCPSALFWAEAVTLPGERNG